MRWLDRVVKITKTESTTVVADGKGNKELLFNGRRLSVLKDE